MVNFSDYRAKLQEISDSLLAEPLSTRTYRLDSAAALIRRLGRELALMEIVEETMLVLKEVSSDKRNSPAVSETVKRAQDQLAKFCVAFARLEFEDDVYSFSNEIGILHPGRTW